MGRTRLSKLLPPLAAKLDHTHALILGADLLLITGGLAARASQLLSPVPHAPVLLQRGSECGHYPGSSCARQHPRLCPTRAARAQCTVWSCTVMILSFQRREHDQAILNSGCTEHQFITDAPGSHRTQRSVTFERPSQFTVQSYEQS